MEQVWRLRTAPCSRWVLTVGGTEEGSEEVLVPQRGSVPVEKWGPWWDFPARNHCLVLFPKLLILKVTWGHLKNTGPSPWPQKSIFNQGSGGSYHPGSRCLVGHDTVYTPQGRKQLGLRSLWVHFGQDPSKVLGIRNLAPWSDYSMEEGGGLGFMGLEGPPEGLQDTGGVEPGDAGWRCGILPPRSWKTHN